jgi:hypothetical protein
MVAGHAPFLATRWIETTTGFQAGDETAKTLIESPLPEGEEGAQARLGRVRGYTLSGQGRV